ncbi:cornifelin homolog isoform X1 [Haliotis asinina]|uniref:cornifelin homolog isoform X1 n=1 Tax=Haliotis asinina TaxID=109174 RepID=UPI003531D248
MDLVDGRTSPEAWNQSRTPTEIDNDLDERSTATPTTPDQTSIVTSQPRPTPKKLTRVQLLMPADDSCSEREWTSGLCECSKGRRNCCMMSCCWLYHRYIIATRVGETPFMSLIPCAAFALRVKVRTLFSIKGSILRDFWAALCCEPCVVCQMTRELDDVGL